MTRPGAGPLRDEGVLVMGSGNLVHNLHTYSWGNAAAEPYDWAIRFETLARQALRAKDFAPLVGYESLGRDAMRLDLDARRSARLTA